MPISVTISCVESRVTGVSRRIGQSARIRHLGAERVLALDDAAGDVLRQHLDEQRLFVDDRVDRLVEELREARHVDALLLGREVDGAVDRRRHHRLAGRARDADGLRDARDAGAGQADADVRRGGLEVVGELRRVGHADTLARGRTQGAGPGGPTTRPFEPCPRDSPSTRPFSPSPSRCPQSRCGFPFR